MRASIVVAAVVIGALLTNGCGMESNKSTPLPSRAVSAREVIVTVIAPMAVQPRLVTVVVTRVPPNVESQPASTSSPETSETSTRIGVYAIIDVASLDLRSGPDVGFPAITRVYADESYPVLGKSSLGIWFELATTVGGGWVAARYVRIQGDVTQLPVTAQDLSPVPPLGVTPLPEATNTPIAPAGVTPSAASPIAPPAVTAGPTDTPTPIAPPGVSPTPSSTASSGP